MKRNLTKNYQNPTNKKVSLENNENKNLATTSSSSTDALMNFSGTFQTDDIYDARECTICNWKKYDVDCSLSKEELNHLLQFTLDRIKSWVRSVSLY